MGEFLDYFKDKKNILNVLIFAILIMVLPLGVNFARRQQIIKSRAAGEPIVFTGANIDQRNGIFVAVKPQISLDITAPLPPTGSKSSTKTANSKDSFVSNVSEKLVGTVYATTAVDPNIVDPTIVDPVFCSDDVTYCDTGAGRLIHKTGGVPDSSQPDGCRYAYVDVGSCSSPSVCIPTITCATAIAGTRCDELAYDNCSNFCGKGTQGCSTTAPPPATTSCTVSRTYDQCGGGSCNGGGGSSDSTHTVSVTEKKCSNGDTIWVCNDLGPLPGQCGNTGGTAPLIPKPGTGTTPTGSAGTYTGTGWYGCAGYVSDGCPDKTRTCITAEGKAGVLCHITCTACGSKASGQAYMSGACGGPTTSNPYCDPAGSGSMIGGTCTWEACTAANTPTSGTCTIIPDVSSACTNCIIGVKNQGGSDLLNKIKSFNHTLFDPCSAEAIVSYWCDKFGASTTAECNSIKSGTCSSACAGTGAVPAPSSSTGGPAPAPSSGGSGGPAPSSSTGGPAPSSSGGGSNPPPTNPPPPPVTTVSFRLADNPSDLASAPEQLYIADPTPAEFEFKDQNPGQKFVWVEFKFSDGTTERHNKQIKLLGPDPQIVSCALSFEGNNTILNLTGQNFGSQKGIINSNDTNLQVKEWKNGSIKAVWPNAPEGEQLPVALTNPDQQKGEGQCSAISRLALGAKVFCRAPSNHNTNNIDLVLAGAFAGGAKARQKVSIDNEGVVQGLTQKLEEGKQYNLSIKALRGLRKSITFTAGSGTTNIPNFILPIGDIFPSDGGDGVINTLDKAELNRQWIIAVSSQRTGDFNQDGRVNSIDWACMRFDFGVSDDPEAVAGAPTTIDVTAPALTNTDTTTNTSSSSGPNPSATSTTNPNPSASSDQTSTQTSTQSLIVSPVPTATSTINSPSKGKGKNKFFLQ